MVLLIFCCILHMSNISFFPEIGQKYRDDHGTRVVVTEVKETCVVFMREEYPYPCMRPLSNFILKFKKIIGDI